MSLWEEWREGASREGVSYRLTFEPTEEVVFVERREGVDLIQTVFDGRAWLSFMDGLDEALALSLGQHLLADEDEDEEDDSSMPLTAA